MSTLDPHATIARAASAAHRSLATERSSAALMGVQVTLVRDLARAFGRELEDGEAAGFAVLCARVALPLLHADLLPEVDGSVGFGPDDAASLTACIGVNTLGALRAAAGSAGAEC
jgi:hypothetical protein